MGSTVSALSSGMSGQNYYGQQSQYGQPTGGTPFYGGAGVVGQQYPQSVTDCQITMQAIQTYATVCLWVTVIIAIIFIICLIAHAKLNSMKCENEERANLFYQIANVVFYIIIFLFLIGLIVSAFQSFMVMNWFNNPYNQNNFVNRCSNFVNNLTNGSNNMGSNLGPVVVVPPVGGTAPPTSS